MDEIVNSICDICNLYVNYDCTECDGPYPGYTCYTHTHLMCEYDYCGGCKKGESNL